MLWYNTDKNKSDSCVIKWYSTDTVLIRADQITAQSNGIGLTRNKSNNYTIM